MVLWRTCGIFLPIFVLSCLAIQSLGQQLQKQQLTCRSGCMFGVAVVQTSRYKCKSPGYVLSEMEFLRSLTPFYAAQLANKRLGGTLPSTLVTSPAMGLLFLDTCLNQQVTVGFAKHLRPIWQSGMTPTRLCNLTLPLLDENFYPIHAMAAGWYSSTTQLVSTLVSAHGLPQIATEASSDALSDKTQFPNVYRLVPPDSYQAKTVVDLILHLNWTYIAILYRDDVYGRGLLQSTRLLLQSARISKSNASVCIAFMSAINVFTPVDEVVQTIRQLPNLKAFLIYELFEHLPETILSEVFTHGGIIVTSDTNMVPYKHYTRGALYISFPSFSTPDLIQFYHSLNASDVVEFPFGDRLLRILFNCTTEDAAACCSDASCRVGSKSRLSVDSVVAPVARLLDSIDILVSCIERVALVDCATAWPNITAVSACVTGPKVMKLLSNSSFPFRRTGNVSFNSNGDGSPAYEIRQEQPDGRLLKVGVWTETSGLDLSDLPPVRWWNNTTSNPHQLQQDLPKSFCSAPCNAGEIKLDTDACCFTCKPCFKQEIVSEDGRSCLSCSEFHWPGQDRLSCEAIPVYVWRDGLQFPVLLVCLGVLTIFLLTVLALFINRRDHKLIKASSIHLSVTCMSGNLLGLVFLALIVVDSSHAMCNALNCSFQLSLTACYASQLVKTFRVHLIFSASRVGRPVPWLARQKPMLILLTGVILGMCLLLTGVTVFRPLSAELKQIVTDPAVRPLVEKNCAIAATAFWAPLCCNLLILTVTCGLSMKTRSLPDNFHDTKCILASGVSGLFLWSAFVPSALTASSLTTAMLLLAFSSSLTHALLLSILFAPKLYAVYARPEAENNVQFYTANAATTITTPN